MSVDLPASVCKAALAVRAPHRPFVVGLALALVALASGCATETAVAPPPKVAAKKQADGTIDDQSRCEWRGRADRETTETAGPGYVQPNVRRVYQVIGQGDDRQRVLVCRELDTNFDGVKDVVRRYNEKGESLYEESDTNFDGRIDTWLTFSKGHIAEMKVDTNRDGNPDQWKYYSAGKLARVKRDTNRDGKPDVWEIYRDGHLERMGVDVDGDEKVDRWDHDSDTKRRIEDEERKKEEADAKKREAEQKAGEYNEAEPEPEAAPKAAKKPAAKKK